MMNERKEYEDCQSFQEYVDELVRRTMKRIEEEMPDEGGFSDIFELFCNPDDGTSDVLFLTYAKPGKSFTVLFCGV